MKKIIKNIVFTLVLVLIASTILKDNVYAAQVQTYQNFEYQYNEQYKGIEIVKYNGKEAKVTIPSEIDGVSVNSIGEKAFFENKSIKEVIIPDGVKYFGGGVFASCTKLEKVELPKNVEQLGECMFSHSELKSITLPSNIVSIPEYFLGYTPIQTITIPNSVKTIDSYAFEGCYELRTVKFQKGSSLTNIGDEVFRSCTALKTITIPDNIKKMGQGVFLYCGSLEQVKFSSNSKLTAVSHSLFRDCKKLKKVTLGPNVKSIGLNSFINCKSLKTVTFNGNVPKMKANSFTKVNSKVTFRVPAKYASKYTKAIKKAKWYKSSMKIKKL